MPSKSMLISVMETTPLGCWSSGAERSDDAALFPDCDFRRLQAPDPMAFRRRYRFDVVARYSDQAIGRDHMLNEYQGHAGRSRPLTAPVVSMVFWPIHVGLILFTISAS